MVIAQTNSNMSRRHEFIVYKSIDSDGISISASQWCEYTLRTKFKYHTLYLELIYE